MRGEYLGAKDRKAGDVELPPHARRIRVAGLNTTAENGTTSACAENTTSSRAYTADYRNYLRMRGEYFGHYMTRHHKPELPPRARRILKSWDRKHCVRGTTSACAENTRGSALGGCTLGNYLRVRGEYR